MPKQSAGILLYRVLDHELQVLLVHMGGPYWRNKDQGAWSIPKGEYQIGEDPFAAAIREFREETSASPTGEYIPLTPTEQSGGKTVRAWAVEGDFDPQSLRSNTFTMEWPPKSGKMQEFSEVDRAEWFSLEDARLHVIRGQIPLLDELASILRTR